MNTKFKISAALISGFIITIILASKIKPAPVNQLDNNEFQILKYNNPGAITDLGVGLWAWPLPMDYDNDGDMDMVVSCPDKPYNGIYFFENKSGSSHPVFEPPVRLANSLKDVQLSYINDKARILIPGYEIKNFSKTFGLDKQELFPVDSVLKDFKKKPRFNQWKLVDYDDDGDEDIVAGIDDWSDYGWDNAYDKEGKWTNGPLHGYLHLIENLGGTYIILFPGFSHRSFPFLNRSKKYGNE